MERLGEKMAARVQFDMELKQLRTAVSDMSERMEISYDKLVYASANNDREGLSSLLDVDRDMVDKERSIEAKCLTLLTRQQPVARDLRAISAALKVVNDVQRIGAHVADMAELFLRLKPPFSPDSEKVIYAMLEEAKDMVHNAVEAFLSMDEDSARRVIRQDDVIDDYFNQVKRQMADAGHMPETAMDNIVDYLLIAKYLEKIGDHAVNIGEWAIFQVTGNMEEKRLL